MKVPNTLTQDQQVLPKIAIIPTAVYTTDEAAAILMRSKKTVYNLVKKKQLRARITSQGYRILGQCICDYLCGYDAVL